MDAAVVVTVSVEACAVLPLSVIEAGLSVESPALVNLANTLEIVWVLRSVKKLRPAAVVRHLEELLTTDVLLVQNWQEIFQAMTALEDGSGEFEDALIGALNQWSGCTKSVTFDQKAARLPYFRLLA